MDSPAFTLVVWAIAWLLHLGCAILLWRRGLLKQYFLFFVFLVVQLVCSLILHPLSYLEQQDKAYYAAYFYAYWITETVSVALITAIVFKVFRQEMSDFRLLQRLGSVIYLAVTAGCLFVAMIAAATAPATDNYPFTTALLSFTSSMQILRFGTMVAFLAFALVLALPLRSFAVGLTLGYGLEAGLSLILTALRQQLGHAFTPWYNSLIMLSYVVALIVFFAYLVAPKRELHGEHDLDDKSLRPWNDALSEYLRQ